MSEIKKSNLDAICWEIEAYKKLYNTWINYGDYIGIARPELEKTGGLSKVKAYAKELEERSKRSKKRCQTHRK